MSIQIKMFYSMKLVIPHHVKIHQVTINNNNISNINKLHAIRPKGVTIKVKTTGTIGINNNLLSAPALVTFVESFKT